VLNSFVYSNGSGHVCRFWYNPIMEPRDENFEKEPAVFTELILYSNSFRQPPAIVLLTTKTPQASKTR